MNLKTAVNAKTPRGKGARDRKMTREKQVYITHPVGDSPQQPNPSAYYPYGTWILSIDDTNDVNHNGIPDFSDDPPSTLPSRPSLTLRPTATNLWLTIHGDTGHVHQVQQSLSLPASRTATNWQTVLSVTLTNCAGPCIWNPGLSVWVKLRLLLTVFEPDV